MRRREAQREAEEERRLPSSLYEEVRQRNRLDRLRRACRQGSQIVTSLVITRNIVTMMRICFR